MVLNTEWAQVEVIDLINDGSGLAFGIIGGRSTGVVVKTIVPGGVADRDGRLQSGDHILQIGEVNLRGLGSEQVASVLRQCGVHVRMIVARPIESTSLDIQSLVSHAPVVPTKILGDPVELDKHLIENGFGDIFSTIPPSNNYTTPYIYTGQQTDFQLHSIPRLNDFRNSTNGSVLSVPANISLASSKILPLDVDLQKQPLPETEMYTVKLCKDDLGLGITVAGYVCEKEEISGIFVKSISEGSAADINGKIKVNDRIVEVDGMSVVGQTNHQAVEILRNTGPIVTITLERYLRGPKYEQLQQAIRANELKPPSPPSPSISSLPKIPLSLVNSSIEPDGDSRTSFDFDPAILLDLVTPTNEEQEIVIDGRKSVQFSICSHESIMDKWKLILEEDAQIVIAEMNKDDNSGLGISLEGTVDVEGGQEVRPHHYIRNILPNGPVGKHGALHSGDELLEVNGIQLLGMNHLEVISILKQLPNLVILVCARRSVPTRIIDTAQCRDAFQARNILAGSLQTLIPNSEKLVKAKSDTSIASSAASETCSDLASRSRSLEAVIGLPLWTNEHTVVDLLKGDYGLGFSILDYQDPLDSEKTVIVIRSLVPGGVAQNDGRLIPGDRLIAVNDTIVDHGTLDRAVQVLKSAPKGTVRITVAKPLSPNDNASYHSQDTDQEDQIYLDEFQECIEEYQECLEVVQICIDDDAVSFNHSASTTQLEDMKVNDANCDCDNNWLNVSFDSDVYKMDELKTVSESDVSFKSTCDKSDSLEQKDSNTKSVELTTVKNVDSSSERVVTKAEETSEKDGYETCVDESFSDEIKTINTSNAEDKTPTNSNIDLNVKDEEDSLLTRQDASLTSTPNTVLSVNLSSSSEPFLNKNDFDESNHICLDSKMDDDVNCCDHHDDSLCGDEFFLVQCYKEDLSNFRSDVTKCSSEPNVLDTYEVCVPAVRYRRCIKEYYNDYEDCLESYRIYLQQSEQEKKRDCQSIREMLDDEIFNEILLPMRSKSAPNVLDNSFVALTYDPGPELCMRRKSAFVAGYPEDLNTESMTVTTNLDNINIGPRISDYSIMLQKHWGSIRKVEINREPSTSLGISIVGGKVDIHASKTPHETILGIFIKNVVPDSPAGRTGKLNTGDRILEVSGIDLRETSHEKAVEIIRNAPNPVVFLIQSLIPWNIEDNHETADNKSSTPILSPENIKPPEDFRSEPITCPFSIEVNFKPSEIDAKASILSQNLKKQDILSSNNIQNKTVPIIKSSIKEEKIEENETSKELQDHHEKADVPKVQIDLSPQVFGLAKELKSVEKTSEQNKELKDHHEKADVPKVQIDLSPQVFGLAKEVKSLEKTSDVTNQVAHEVESSEESDGEEDVRLLEGRTVSAKGQEIDRASAANVRRTKEEEEADPDEEDDFGYTMRRSKKGWMSSQTFYSYVCNTFLPHLKGKGVKLPILYLLDGHKSHLTYNLSKFCAENGIFLYALFPNATHIIQPADVSLFAPLKCNWKKIVFDWRKANNNKCVNKATFPVLLENAVQQVTADTVKNGFRKCGIYPYNVEAIDFTKCMQGTSRTLGENEEEQLKPTEFKISHFLYFESVIPSKRRKEFRETEMGEWVGDESSKELFEVWKELKSRCTKNKEEEERSDTDTEQELLTVENRNTDIYESTENDPNVIPTHEISEVNKNREEVNIDKTDVRKDATKIYETGNHQTIIVETEKQATVHEEISENLEQRKESTTEEINQESRIIIHSNVVQTRPTTPTLTNNNPQKHQKQTISTSFIDHIFWPEESPQKNDSCRKKERLPHATTSLRWLQYHEDKEKLKMQKEEAKREKAMLRKKKKEEKLEKAETKLVKRCRKRKVKQRDDSESEEHEDWSESGTSIDDISDEHFTSDSDNETLAKIAKREETCSSHTENESLAKIAKADERCLKGDFYLVSFPGKKKSHNYVCCIQNIFSSNEVEVQALCATGEDRSTYKIIENDISTVDIEQLLYKLEEPKIIGTGNRRRYKFSSEIM